MGGVVDVGLRNPKSDAWHGMGDVNPIDASLLAEGPVGKNVSLALAFGRSYIDAFFGSLANSSDLQITAAPVYYDYQAMLTWKPTAVDHVRAFVFGTADAMRLVLKKFMESDPAFRRNVGMESAVHRLQVGWKHLNSDAFEHDIGVGVGPLGEDQSIGQSLRLHVPFRQRQSVYARGIRAVRRQLDLYRPIYGLVNTGRNDPFMWLDLQVEKGWVRSWGRVAAYLDVQNATNRLNAEGRYYNFDYS